MTGPGRLLYLSRSDVEACGVAPLEIVDALEAAFVAKGRGQVDMPPKPGIHPRPDAFLHAMPCYVGGQEAAGIKWVSGYPGNPARGLPYISGLLILNDPDTGIPLAVLDCTWITAWRTAAVSALAARRLARSGSAVLAICGAGVQGQTHLDTLALVLPELREVRVYDVLGAVQERYLARNRGRHPGLTLRGAGSAREAVEGADVVVTAGPIRKEPEPVVTLEWLAPGCLGLPVDFDSYFGPEALLGCDKFLTDDLAQLRYYQTLGYFRRLPPVHGDLGQLLAGQVGGRTSPEERIVVCSLGIAMDDVATAPLVVERARERGLGTWLEL